MRERGSSSRNSEALALILALPVLLSGCGARAAWGMPAAELKARLARADFSSLASVDLAKHAPAEALAIGPEAPYYLAFGFDAVKRPDAALAMLEVALERSPEPWRSEAGVELADRLVDGKEYGKAEAAARKVLDEPGSADVALRARRVLVEAVYWQKRDAEVLDRLADLSPDPELELFRAVSSWRLDLPQARGLFVELFRTEPVSSLHGRAYTFLASDPAWLVRFSQPEQDLLAAKYALARGEWIAGIELLERVLAGLAPERIAGSSLVYDLGNAYVSGGRTAQGGAFLERVAARLAGQARIDCLETAGRLYRRAGDRSRALRLLSLAAKSTTSLQQADRARWYLLDVLIEMNPGDLIERLAVESRSWNVPSRFSDLLEALLSDLVARRRWTEVARLRDALAANGPPDVRAHLAWLLARLLEERKLPIGSVTGGVSAFDLLEEAAQADPDGYYGVLAACMLGRLPASVAPVRQAASDRSGSPSAPSAESMQRALGPLAEGFLRYGVTAEAYRRVVSQREELAPDIVQEAARELARAGDYRSALNLMAYLAEGGALPTDGLKLLYPKPWGQALASSAADNRLPEGLLAALVREESFFDPEIVSSAGAVGLTQLMPDAASDAARRLKLSDPDLKDPVTNLRLGSRHLRGLLDSAGSPVKALLAYNAGLSRLRSWERSWSDLPEDLLVEAVPYEESRGYVRKIVVSDLIYEWLYGGKDPRETLRGLFPAVASLREGPRAPPEAPGGASRM